MGRAVPFVVLAAIIGGVIPASTVTAAPPAKYFSSCAMLSMKYPSGVAKNAEAAKRSVRQGYGRPSTSRAAKKTYWDNQSRLDRDRDGVACES